MFPRLQVIDVYFKVQLSGCSNLCISREGKERDERWGERGGRKRREGGERGGREKLTLSLYLCPSER